MCLFVLITFEPILDYFLKFWEKSRIQDGGLTWRHSDMITQLLRHATSSPHDADAKGDILIHTIYPSSFAVIAVIFSELRLGGGGGGGGG